MRFLWRNAIFILFPAVMVALIFLASISFGTAFRFGEWGERSVAESTLIVTKEKIERIEETIGTTDDTFFGILHPAHLTAACESWRRTAPTSRLVEAAVLVDDYGDIVAFLHHDTNSSHAASLRNLFEREIIPLLDKYESLDQYKHLHRLLGGEYRLITHLTTLFQGQDYTTVLLYDNDEIVDSLLADLLDNVGSDRVANVVDDHNQIVFGKRIDRSGQFIVSRRFPSTLYKWRLQLAPTSAALFSSREQAQAKRFSQVMLIPLALGVILLGLVVLYLSIVRERRVSRLKSDFIANVSHELKTPLSLIRMFGELLLLGKVRDETKARRYSEVIVRETERLTTLIENVLNLSKIERGKGTYELKQMDISDAVERGVEVYKPRLETSGTKLEYSTENRLPPARIDEHAITLAVINLIDNAVKYAAGTDMIGVKLHTQGSFIHLDVYDRGVGIPAAQLKRIFERFYRVPSEETRKQRGSGIGLSLVKHIAEEHHGEILVVSNPGVETRFSIRIPISHDTSRDDEESEL
ncbi:MAG: HAMP domain-containing histidine kinase [Deltaproteobacteria bacterium]|nr:HAMP domain-containing histidine kinase [Deltaproteobacteria bacterium]